MYKQLHNLQEIKQPLRLTHDEMRMHKLIYRLGRPPKDSKLANSPIDTKTKNVDKPVQNKKTITKKVDWSSDDYFPLLKADVDA